MNSILDPFRDPVAGESDEDEETDNSRTGAAAAASWVRASTAVAVGRLKCNVDRHQCDGEPCGERDCHNTAKEADQENMARMTCNIHRRLEHHNCERDARDPADEAEYSKDRKDSEDDPCAPQVFIEVIDSRSNCQADVQYPRDPDELLCEVLRSEEVCPGEGECDCQNECEQDDRVCVEREVVLSIVNSSSAEAVVFRILVEGIARDTDEAKKDEDQL